MNGALTITPTVDIRRLAAMRRQRGLTQAQLARQIGAAATDIAKVERAVMPGELVDKIFDALTAEDTCPQT